MRPLFVLVKNSRFFVAIGIILLAAGLLGLIRDKTPMPEKQDHQQDLALGESADFDPDYPGVHDQQNTDILDREFEMFHIPELKVESLITILEDEGLELVCPEETKSLILKGLHFGGKPLGAILQEVFRSHGYGILRQAQQVILIPVQQEIKYQPIANDTDQIQRTNQISAKFKVQSGVPFDLWTDSEPAVRLRIVGQPLYGDEVDHSAPPFKLVIEAQRNMHPWFTQHLEVNMNQPAIIEMQGTEMLRCTLTPRSVEGSEFILEVTFYHEFITSSQ